VGIGGSRCDCEVTGVVRDPASIGPGMPEVHAVQMMAKCPRRAKTMMLKNGTAIIFHPSNHRKFMVFGRMVRQAYLNEAKHLDRMSISAYWLEKIRYRYLTNSTSNICILINRVLTQNYLLANFLCKFLSKPPGCFRM